MPAGAISGADDEITSQSLSLSAGGDTGPRWVAFSGKTWDHGHQSVLDCLSNRLRDGEVADRHRVPKLRDRASVPDHRAAGAQGDDDGHKVRVQRAGGVLGEAQGLI